MGNDKFLGQIDEELQRLQGDLESTKSAMEKAQAIFEECKVKQQRLIQELKAVDLMKQNLVGMSKKNETVSAPENLPDGMKEEDLQQPPEDYDEEK